MTTLLPMFESVQRLRRPSPIEFEFRPSPERPSSGPENDPACGDAKDDDLQSEQVERRLAVLSEDFLSFAKQHWLDAREKFQTRRHQREQHLVRRLKKEWELARSMISFHHAWPKPALVVISEQLQEEEEEERRNLALRPSLAEITERVEKSRRALQLEPFMRTRFIQPPDNLDHFRRQFSTSERVIQPFWGRF